MELILLLTFSAVLVAAAAAFGLYSRTEHGFFTLREARRQIRRRSPRRPRQWEY